MQKRVKVFFNKKVVDSIYKILPLFEEKNEGYNEYVDSLVIEINGVVQYLDENDTNIISLLGVLKSLSLCNVSESEHSTVKREVFKAIGLAKAISEKMG